MFIHKLRFLGIESSLNFVTIKELGKVPLEFQRHGYAPPSQSACAHASVVEDAWILCRTASRISETLQGYEVQRRS